MDLERLDEALDGRAILSDDEWDAVILDAARAYRDLLANGERVEPDYVAAAKVLYESRPEVTSGRWPHWRDLGSAACSLYLTNARTAVDAAIGDRLLIPPTEEEA